jgi:hypothetical protein
MNPSSAYPNARTNCSSVNVIIQSIFPQSGVYDKRKLTMSLSVKIGIDEDLTAFANPPLLPLTFQFMSGIISLALMQRPAASFFFWGNGSRGKREGIMTEKYSWKSDDGLNRVEPGERMQSGVRSRKAPGWGWLQSPRFHSAALFLAILLSSPLYALEDSARLVFQKTAGSGKSRVHVVQKGEWIAGILRGYFGEEQVPYALIRRLNPGIGNLNRIRPGQRIVLPVPSRAEPSKQIPDMVKEDSSPQVIYRIMEGDSISRIILSEMNVDPAEALPAYRLIRKLNPEIQDFNQLPVGQTLRLPPADPRPAVPPPAPLMTAALSTEKPDAETAAILNSLLAIIRPVIGRMGGAVNATGSYFIPLQETTQITIDCSQIPVVELDDGTTVFLDYADRLSENLKGLISQSGKNYAFLAAEAFRDRLGGLLGIIRHSRNYRMVRAEKPLELTLKPEISIFPDWIISGKETAGGAIYRQGLFLLDPGERPLPVDARAFTEKSGFVVTEIMEDRLVSSLESPPALQPAIADLQALNGIAFAERLLATLGEKPIRNAEVVVFDQDRNGFNLSVTADLLIRKGEKKFILLTKRLPEQFLHILREAGTEVILIGENDQGRPLIEGVLQGLGIPVSFGHFSFRIPEEGLQPRFTASFSALRTMKEGEPIFLIDFDIPPPVLPFFNGLRGGRVVRY